MARLLSDENFSLRVVRELRALGHDILTSREAGLANQGIDDPDILQAAVAAGRAILTNDRRDYVRLHLRRPDHPGIVVCTFDPDTARLARRIHAALSALDSLAGRLVRVNRPGPAEPDA
jgi:predicted nuclease of predicted toxin-antitoxin system